MFKAQIPCRPVEFLSVAQTHVYPVLTLPLALCPAMALIDECPDSAIECQFHLQLGAAWQS